MRSKHTIVIAIVGGCILCLASAVQYFNRDAKPTETVKVLSERIAAKQPPPPFAPHVRVPASDVQPVSPAADEDKSLPDSTIVVPPSAQLGSTPPNRKFRSSANRKPGSKSGQGGGAGPSEKDGEPPIARAALSYVGMDPEADAVWLSSINDPQVPPGARKNLIEDLNEDGFPDPENMTPGDVPLIITRMGMIETLAPGAMDDVNTAAFAEAYKDLTNMLKQAQGG